MHKLRWHNYTLPNGRKVYLTVRPDEYCDKDEVARFIREKNPIMRFQYTDDWITPPKDGPDWLWFNWIPNGEPTLESVFASTSSLYHINEETEDIGRSLWLHCDSSSMRAPTYFGLFLHAVYPDKVDEISETYDAYPTDIDHYEYKKNSMPNRYAKITLESKKCLEIKKHIEAWKSGGEAAAYEHYMKRSDSRENIIEAVKTIIANNIHCICDKVDGKDCLSCDLQRQVHGVV